MGNPLKLTYTEYRFLDVVHFYICILLDLSYNHLETACQFSLVRNIFDPLQSLLPSLAIVCSSSHMLKNKKNKQNYTKSSLHNQTINIVNSQYISLFSLFLS